MNVVTTQGRFACINLSFLLASPFKYVHYKMYLVFQIQDLVQF